MVVDFQQPVRVDCHLLVAHCALYVSVSVCVRARAQVRVRVRACACVRVLAVGVRTLPVCCVCACVFARASMLRVHAYVCCLPACERAYT